MARAVCDLPEPDSPTIASFSRPRVNETSRTTWLVPLAEWKRMLSFSTSRFGVVIGSSLLPGIEHVAQPIAHQVEPEADDEDGDAGIGAHPPLIEDVAAAIGHHRTPFGLRQRHA